MVAVDLKSALAPALKEFLKLVDGKTSPEQLLARWRDGPDAVQLLQELERRGLVEVRSIRWSNSSGDSAFSHSAVPTSVLPALAGAKTSPQRLVQLHLAFVVKRDQLRRVAVVGQRVKTQLNVDQHGAVACRLALWVGAHA